MDKNEFWKSKSKELVFLLLDLFKENKFYYSLCSIFNKRMK
ncbi:hypothetical protein [Mycoplasma struthionis]|nr:hypothetical protein [Mycoplasma struthionis]